MKVLSFNGVAFAAHDTHGGIPWAGASGQFSLRTTVHPIQNTKARFGGGVVTERRLPVEFVLESRTTDIRDARAMLYGRLDPENPTPRELIVEWHNGQQYAALATVELQPGDESINVIPVVFVAADPVWRKIEAASITETQAISSAGETIEIVNTGHATTNLIVTIAGTSTGGTGSASTLAFRRTFTVGLTADATDPLRHQWVRIPLGDTTGWVAAGKALSDGSNVYVFTADGQEVRRELINFNDTVSYLGITVIDLAPGVTREYVIAYGDALATSPLSFSSGDTSAEIIAAKRAAPVFRTDAHRGTSTSVTSTTITQTGAGFDLDEWAQGDLQFLTGAAAGQSRGINGNTVDTITVASAFSPAPANGDIYLVTMSRTDKYVNDVRTVEDNSFKRGLWWLNRGQSQPSRFSFDSPGAWQPILTIQNNDDKVQKLWTPIEPGGTTDYKSMLDVNYGWDGRFSDAGDNQEVANGITFSSALPIISWRVGWQFKNPNGMTKAIFAMRESGATDWEPITTDTDDSDTLADNQAATFSAVPTEGATKQLAAFLLPFNEEEIPLDWIKDTGTATSGSAGQVNDNTKEWASDQYIGGRIRFLSGAGAPQTRTVGDNSPNTVTPTVNFSPPPDDTTRYQLTNKPLLATLRSFDEWAVTFDVSAIAISAVSAEADNYDLALTIRLDGGSPAAGPYQRARVGLDGTRVMFGTGQALRLDGERRAIEIITVATGAVVRTIATGVVVQDVDTDDDPFLAGHWLALIPGSHELFLEWDAGNAPIGADITVAWTEGVLS